MKSRLAAAALAFFFGAFGAHKFYLNKSGQGFLYLIFCWTYIPAIISFFEGIGFLIQSDDKFLEKYCAQWFAEEKIRKEEERRQAELRRALQEDEEDEPVVEPVAEPKLKLLTKAEAKSLKIDNGVLTIPEGVGEIEERAFENNHEITEVNFPESLKKIGYSAFCGCENLYYTSFPDGLKEIDHYAFSGCKLSFTPSLPDSLEYIGSGAFENTQISYVDIPKGVSTIESDTFSSCSRLDRVDLGKVNTICDGAFESCSILEEVEFPKTLSYIESNAFRFCRNLTKVTFTGRYISSVADDAFDFCKNLESIVVPSERLDYYIEELPGVYCGLIQGE